MSYTWENGEVITAEKLNNTGGSDVLVVKFDDGNGMGTWTCSCTFDEILEAYNTGKVIIPYYQRMLCPQFVPMRGGPDAPINSFRADAYILQPKSPTEMMFINVFAECANNDSVSGGQQIITWTASHQPSNGLQ